MRWLRQLLCRHEHLLEKCVFRLPSGGEMWAPYACADCGKAL